ncbi:MAG: hypothetical protein AABM43_09795 [Actinomycetota bacterium]
MLRPRLLLWLLTPLTLALAGCVAERPADPVVFTGANVPRLQGVAPGKVIGYRYRNERWEQSPVQVDERAVIDLAKPKNATPVGHTFLSYTDPNTFTGSDPNTNLDANDEIVFMGIDAGAKAPAGSTPPGVVAGSGVEVKIVDSLGNPTPAYLYLFHQTGNLDPGAGRRYVDYRFNLLSGNYKATYNLNSGPNPEDSTISTDFYSHHFSDRWIDDQLRITAPNASGVDLLDRHKNLFAPGECVRNENTFSNGAGALIANKNGPVRAIRSYMGANSGVYTHREHLFYQRRQDITTFLRVHSIPGVMDFFDYTAAATGMTYMHEFDQRGARIDGVPESPTPGQISWETVDGAQGSLGIVHTFSTDLSSFNHTSYYLDKQNPGGGSETQCTGDASAYGASGPRVAQALPNTDPTLGTANRFTATRSLFYDSPGKTDGPRRKAQVTSPLQTTFANWP